IAAVRIAASLYGWTARLLPDWSHADIAALTGIDRDADFVEAEREEPGCLLVVSRLSSVGSRQSVVSRESILHAVRAGQWTGRANQLSADHIQWTFIDEIAEATRDPGREPIPLSLAAPAPPALPVFPSDIVLQRRSAVAFDGRSSIDLGTMITMLQAVMPDLPAFDVLWWSARIHFVLFVHRVNGLDPGLYLLLRDAESGERLKAALGREFLMEQASDALPLVRLAHGDCGALARRVSCDQDIAADGFFSLGMIAEFDQSLDRFGPSFYRHLFWESGVVGQVLYLAAEAAGARATGIRCFYDDPVHDVLGLAGHLFQSLYHFTVGVPVEDTRLTTQPGYPWELR